MRRLPATAWTQRADLAELVRALDPQAQGLTRWVGGAVRDTLLDLPVKDIDMATRLVPAEVIARLTAAGIRTVPTGIEHGTVTALVEGGHVEITTLRRDVSTDGRHATVAFSEDWREDASRRDFTINALYADPASLEISDYFGGLDDLDARRVRFIGVAAERIAEDYLRILRYFRFQARYGSEPADLEAENAISALAPGLRGLSRERVGWEWMRLLAHPDPSGTMRRMGELGVLAHVLPEADPAALPALIAAEAAAGVAPDPLRRLAALLPADPPLAEAVAARLRLSTAQKKRLATAAAREGAPGDPFALAYRLGTTGAIDRLLLAGQDPSPILDWPIPVLPLKGGDIVAHGFAGPDVAKVLRAVENAWIAEGFPDAARVQALCEAAMASLR